MPDIIRFRLSHAPYHLFLTEDDVCFLLVLLTGRLPFVMGAMRIPQLFELVERTPTSAITGLWCAWRGLSFSPLQIMFWMAMANFLSSQPRLPRGIAYYLVTQLFDERPPPRWAAAAMLFANVMSFTIFAN